MHAILALTIVLAGGQPAPLTAQPPDIILYHGKIVTVDDRFSLAEALAVRGDRIVAVGANEAVRGLAGPRTRQIDLGGKTVLPGLIDSHLHLMSSAMYEFDHRVPEMDSIADVLAYVLNMADVLGFDLSEAFLAKMKKNELKYPAETFRGRFKK